MSTDHEHSCEYQQLTPSRRDIGVSVFDSLPLIPHETGRIPDCSSVRVLVK